MDGQTTDPSLVAKNPDIRKRLAAGDPLSREEEKETYRDIVRQISPEEERMKLLAAPKMKAAAQ